MNPARASLLLLCCLSCVFGGQAGATIRLILTADRLNDAAGTLAAATPSLVLVVADTNNDGLTVKAGDFAINGLIDGSGGDDVIIAQMDLSAFETAGVLFDSTPALTFASVPNLNWGPGDNIYVVWFPSLNSSTISISAAASYGSVLMGPTPQDGATVELSYLSSNNSGFFGPGSQDNTEANQIPSSNSAPTEITLTGNQTIPENSSGATVGTLGAVDPDPGNTFAFALTSGDGSGDNGSFEIDGTTLVIASSPDFEAKSSYSIRIRATDQGGLFFEHAFTIMVANVNEAPTNLALNPASVAENAGANSSAGSFTTTDPDTGNTFSYTLVSGAGSTDNAAFTISGANLLINASPNFEAKNSYAIRIRTTDQGGLAFERQFTVLITDVNEAPTNIALSPSAIGEANAVDAVIGTFSSSDPDAAQSFSYTLVSGAGSTDNASFNISGSSLHIGVIADYETKNSYSVRVRSTDNGGLFFEKSFLISVTDLPEAITEITIAGSSAFRSVINKAVIQLLGGASQCKYAYTGTDGISGSEVAIFEGISGADRYIVKTLLKGSTEGISDLVNQTSLADYLGTDATASDRIVGGRMIDPTGKTSYATPRFVFSDISQLNSSTPTPALTGEAVAVLPYIFVANPGAPAATTNITDQIFQAQWSLGELPLHMYTGVPGQNSRVVNVGPTSASGMRGAVQTETRYGAFTSTVQRAGTDNITGPEGTGSVTSLSNPGSGGFKSTADLRAVLARKSDSVNIDDQGAESVMLIGYLPLPDAAEITDVTGGPGVGAVDLTYNGFAYSDAHLRNGAYTLWSYEHLYEAPSLSPAETSFRNAIVLTVSDSMDSQSNGVRIADLNVVRFGGDGGIVLP